MEHEFIVESNKPTVEEVVTPEAVEAEVVTPTPSTEEQAAAENEAPKPASKSRAQKRIESLIQEKHGLARKVQELESKQSEPKSKALDPDDFEDYDDYLSAVKEDKPKEVTKEASKTDDFSLVIEQIQEKFEESREKYQDFDSKVNGMPILTESMLKVINESDDAGEVAYYLANNPQEAQALAHLSPAKMAIEVGKIEVKLSQPKAEPTVPTKKVTQANEPINPVGGANGAPKTIYQAESQAEYEAMRKESTKNRNGFV